MTRALACFLFLTALLSGIFYYPMVEAGNYMAWGGLCLKGLVWSPAAAALLTCLFCRRKVSSLGWRWGKWRYHALSFLIPLGYASFIYVVVWSSGLGHLRTDWAERVLGAFGLGRLPAWSTLAVYFALTTKMTFFTAYINSLGEEIGWRGFLVPELAQRYSFATTSLVSGGIWAAWHYPLVLFTQYNGGTPAWYGLTCFTVMVLGMSFLYAWMRMKSGSLWTATLLHASHNLIVQGFFDRLTGREGITNYVIGEFGFALAIVCVLVGLYFWKRRGDIGEVAAPPVAIQYAAP